MADNVDFTKFKNLGAEKIVDQNGDQAAHIADISDAATGAEIATAVNSIIAALEGAGITASS